ncbi:MAG TPA: hypothetical protein VF153_04860 [Candidatus Limnocylindria bacterium]
MTDNARRLTDVVLQRALAELAAGVDGDVLLNDVLRTVDTRTQVGRRPWDTRGWGRAAALLAAAAALLVAGAIGTTLTLSRPQPTPLPTASSTALPSAASRPLPTAVPQNPTPIEVSDFVPPFTYRAPAGLYGDLFSHGNPAKVYFTDSRAGLSGRFELFPVSGYVHGCGVATGNALPTSQLNTEPTAFLEALRDKVGVRIGPITSTTLGNLPAVSADIFPTQSGCATVMLHIDGLGLSYAEFEPNLNSPAHLIVARVNGRTIGVLMSAPSEAALTDWLPIALAYEEGMVFDVAQ